MATAKTTTLTFRIEPNLKQALRLAADKEHRSIANMVEVMIREYCARVGVAIATAEQLPPVNRGRSAKGNMKRAQQVKKTT